MLVALAAERFVSFQERHMVARLRRMLQRNRTQHARSVFASPSAHAMAMGMLKIRARGRASSLGGAYLGTAVLSTLIGSLYGYRLRLLCVLYGTYRDMYERLMYAAQACCQAWFSHLLSTMALPSSAHHSYPLGNTTCDLYLSLSIHGACM